MKIVRDIFATFALLTTMAMSCSEKEPKPAAGANGPLFLSSTPANGASGVEYEGDISLVLTYDQNIKCLSGDHAKITIDNEAKIAKVNAYDANLTITVNGLASEKTYKVTVPDGIVKGFKQNQEAAKGVTVSFTTKSAPLPPVEEPEEPVDPDNNDAWKQLAKLGLGWNMGNHFDAFYNYTSAGDKLYWPDETCWGNAKCTEQTFTKLYAAGFRSIRIPITWLKTIGPAPDYTIDETWMKRIVEVVGWARDAGLNVIINTHHDEDHYLGNSVAVHRWLNIMDAINDATLNAQIEDEIKGVWTNVANTFKNEGDYLIFESFNEINDGKWGGSATTARQATLLNEWNQVFVDAVRATGGNNATRWLGVPTYCASPSYIKYFQMPTDKAKHTMLAVHCYDPYNFTIASGLPQQKWGHNMNSDNDEKEIKNVLGSLYANYVAKGTPVYMGEFGCSMREYNTDGWKCYKYYLEYFVKACKSYGIPCFLWDNGNEGAGSEHHPYINHGTGAYIDHSKELVDVMVKAMYNTSASYTLDSVYANAPK